jgi:hypothetical protein
MGWLATRVKGRMQSKIYHLAVSFWLQNLLFQPRITFLSETKDEVVLIVSRCLIVRRCTGRSSEKVHRAKMQSGTCRLQECQAKH